MPQGRINDPSAQYTVFMSGRSSLREFPFMRCALCLVSANLPEGDGPDAAAIGAALGDWLSYWVGFHYHEQIQQMWPLKTHPKLLEKGRVFFKRWGAWGIVIARFSGPLRASVPIVAGIAEIPWVQFQFANWSSAFLWAFVLLSPGSWGMKWWTQYFS